MDETQTLIAILAALTTAGLVMTWKIWLQEQTKRQKLDCDLAMSREETKRLEILAALSREETKRLEIHAAALKGAASAKTGNAL